MALGLQDFAGRWRLSRRIADPDGQTMGRFEGAARFAPDAATLLYREDGTLVMDGREMEAEQTHVWRQEGNRICVAFSDGRPFHSFELGVATASAHHHCTPDLYHVSYDFRRWPEWETSWNVTGPRKDYHLVSVYRRVAGAEDPE